MLFLVQVLLTLWVSSAHGQGRTCDFPEIKHGSIYEENRYKPTFPVATGKYFYYSCDHSFVSPSRSLWTQINCTEGGWSPTPRCIRQCFFPWVENGHSTSAGRTHQEGDSVQIVCDKGYSLANNQDVITCAERGWSTAPTCSRIKSTDKCGPPPAIDNGDITTFPLSVYTPGSSVEYQCQAYYELEGNRRITCRDGQWSEPPKCLDLPCGSPPPVQNAFIPDEKPRYRHGDTARYQCRHPLGLLRNAGVTCLSGKWTDPPECKAMTCPSPPSYDNAILKSKKKKSYRSGEQVTYTCKEHYQMDRSNFVECRDGSWIGRPTCKDPFCGSPPPVQNAFIPGEKPRYRHEDTARYECRHPLGLFGNAVVTCLSGKWTDPPECKDSTGKCGPPPVIDNGDITTYQRAVYAPGSSVEYQCQAYYELEGNRRITCRDGEWSEPPKCLDVSCGSPPPVQNAFIPDEKPRYRHGDTACYQCRHPLGLLRNAGVTCLSGKWTDPPECKAMTCPSPPSYDNAILKSKKKKSYRSGEQVTYTCKEHYQMDRSNFVECRDGSWIGTPTCKDPSCGSPPPVQNAFIPGEKPRYRHEDTARYVCRHPLGLFGNAVVTCLSGKWTDPPECKDSTGICGPPPVIDNGDITTYQRAVYAPGSSVEYQCQAYYELEGNRRITCRDGEWSEPPKCLDACILSEEIMREHNIELQWSYEKKFYSRTNDYTEFRCRRGYRAVSPASAFRAQCREGKMEYPTCA